MATGTAGGTGTPDAAGATTDAEKAAAAAVVAAAAAQTQTPEQKATAATAAADKATADAETASTAAAAAAAAKAPEKYTLAVPDGGRLDAHDLAAIETVARAQGWTNEEAQARVVAHAAAIDAQSAQFESDTKADAVYGGQQLAGTLKHAAAALDRLRPAGTVRGDAFRALLDKSGYGNHLEVVSLLADLGKTMAEDGHVAAGVGAGGSKRDAAAVLYDKT